MVKEEPSELAKLFLIDMKKNADKEIQTHLDAGRPVYYYDQKGSVIMCLDGEEIYEITDLIITSSKISHSDSDCIEYEEVPWQPQSFEDIFKE